MPAVSERVDLRRTGSGSWTARDEAESRSGLADVCARLYAGQRCDGGGSAEKRRAVDAGQGIRYVLPGGPLVSDEVDPDVGLELETRVNSALRQHGSTKISSCDSRAAAVHYGSDTLEPATGADRDAGRGGPVATGDRVDVAMRGWAC